MSSLCPLQVSPPGLPKLSLSPYLSIVLGVTLSVIFCLAAGLCRRYAQSQAPDLVQSTPHCYHELTQLPHTLHSFRTTGIRVHLHIFSCAQAHAALCTRENAARRPQDSLHQDLTNASLGPGTNMSPAECWLQAQQAAGADVLQQPPGLDAALISSFPAYPYKVPAAPDLESGNIIG